MFTKGDIRLNSMEKLPRIVRENPRDTQMMRNLSKKSDQSRDNSHEKKTLLNDGSYKNLESRDSLSPSGYKSMKLPYLSVTRSSRANMEQVSLMTQKK